MSRTAATAISAGGYQTCALTSAGAVKCWGVNANGQLGNDSTVDSHVPIDVVGLSSGVVAVSAGAGGACAITAAGAIECWGVDSHVPVDVVGLSCGVVAVSTRGPHTCVLTAGGAVKCWGFNGAGELGNDSYVDSPVPVDVMGLSSDILAVSAGGYHTCALTAAGAVKCWGWNQDGQLGNSSYSTSGVPVDVVSLSPGIITVSAGWEHTCALTTAGAVKCWGANGYGELGDGSTTFSNVPVDVVGLSSGVIAISAGANHTCALTAAGAVKCWGWNQYGALGNDSTIDSPVPVDVVGL